MVRLPEIDLASATLRCCGTEVPRGLRPALQGKHADIRTSHANSVFNFAIAGGLGPAEAGSGPGLAHQDGSLRSFQSDGPSLLAERRLRPASDRLAGVLPGCGVGRRAAARDRSQQRASGNLGAVRPRLVGPAMVGGNGRTALRAAERYAAGLERKHQWSYYR